MRRLFPAVLALLLLLTACAPSAPVTDSGADNTGSSTQNTPSGEAETPPTEPEEPAPPPDPRQEAIDTLLSSMTLEEKVGQMFFVRCPEFDAVADVTTYHLGGYLLFGRDFKDRSASDVTDLLETFQAMSAIPMLIGVDEEGGSVVRLSSNPNLAPDGKFRSPQRLYAQGGLEAIREDTRTINEGLLSYGINVNFAPVADVSTNSADFIYDRTLGQDAAATAEYVAAAVEEMGAVGIGSVLKHFPGYGSNSDTHTGVAIDSRPYDQFLSQDFLPFQAGIDAGAGCVLVNHNVVESMDGTLPASLSPEVHRILREELGFTGVTLTDDLAMDAVEAYAEDGSVAVLAVLAGNDMIVTTDFEEQIPLVIAAVESGAIDEDLIDQAVSRVLGWKYDLGLLG